MCDEKDLSSQILEKKTELLEMCENLNNIKKNNVINEMMEVPCLKNDNMFNENEKHAIAKGLIKEIEPFEWDDAIDYELKVRYEGKKYILENMISRVKKVKNDKNGILTELVCLSPGIDVDINNIGYYGVFKFDDNTTETRKLKYDGGDF